MYIDSQQIFNCSDHQFNALALDIFQYQSKYNPVYKQFVDLMGIDPTKIKELSEIPFLPIQLFKSHQVICQANATDKIFESSSTTGMGISKHYIPSLAHYKESIAHTFKSLMGHPNEYIILALLPGYLERDTSSLVYMVNHLMELSDNDLNGFYLHNTSELIHALTTASQEKSGKKILLIGVTWALLDFAAKYKDQLPPNILVMETGGMKGRKKEMIREELHLLLKQQFKVDTIYAEYGMTELQSMAYSKGQGLYTCPNWMKVIIKESTDSQRIMPITQAGSIHIIDLANIETCSFIATQDIGRAHSNGTFEVLGRLDNSDIRGCSLMAI